MTSPECLKKLEAVSPSQPEKASPERVSNESGVALIEWLLISVAIIPIFFFFASIPRWSERISAAEAAAAEGARAALLEQLSTARAGAAVAQANNTASGYGIPVSTSVSGSPLPGEYLTVTSTVSLPVLDLPFTDNVASIQYTATYTERVPDYD